MLHFNNIANKTSDDNKATNYIVYIFKKNIHLHGDMPIMEHFVMIARRN